MSVVIVILIIALIVFGVWWNHRNAALARQGVTFVVPYPPAAVAEAIERSYNQGAKAALRSYVAGVSVTPLGPSAFATGTKWGDSGEISISRNPSGSQVTARALSLYVGSHPRTHNMRWAGITHGIFAMLGITPFAAKYNRWHKGLESRITKTIARASA